MIWLILLVAVVLVVLTTAAVLGRVDGSLGDATTSVSHDPLPDTPLTPADFEELHFDTAMRGYRMSEVDDVIDRLRREINDLNKQRSLPPAPTTPAPTTPAASATPIGSSSPDPH